MKKKYTRDHRSGIAKGKLIDKNRNMLSFLRKYQLLPSNKSSQMNTLTDKDSSNEG